MIDLFRRGTNPLPYISPVSFPGRIADSDKQVSDQSNRPRGDQSRISRFLDWPLWRLRLSLLQFYFTRHVINIDIHQLQGNSTVICAEFPVRLGASVGYVTWLSRLTITRVMDKV